MQKATYKTAKNQTLYYKKFPTYSATKVHKRRLSTRSLIQNLKHSTELSKNTRFYK